MEKSELSTRDRMCSVAGGMAGLLVDREIPSRLIPFRGEFPLLDMIEAIRFREAIRSTMWIEDLPPKFLYAAAEGSRIARLEREFRHYLSRNGLKSGDFEKLEDAEKSEWLRWWMEADSVSADDLVVKKYRDEATPVSKSLGDPAMPVAEKREIYDDLVARRAYWDDLCFEFGRIGWEKKLLNLALYIHYGGDLEVVLARYKENHPDYADRIPHSLAYYISYLRTGEATSVLHYFLLERVYLSEGQLTALLIAELRERLEEVFCWDGGTNSAWTVGIDYRGEEKMNEIVTTLDIEKGREYLIFGNLTIKPFIMETKETLLKENPWRVLAEMLAEKDYAEAPENLVCPDERAVIDAYNETAPDLRKIRCEGVPEPVQGDFFNAKVALLTLNPGWVEQTAEVPGNAGTLKIMTPAQRRKFLRTKADAMLLNGCSFPTEDEDLLAIDTRYWNNLLGYVLNRWPDAPKYLTIVQYLGYHSKKYGNISKRLVKSESGLLPTQEFAVRLVRYLMNKGVTIVICRSARLWFNAVEGLESYPKLVVINNPLRPYLTPKNCKDDGFEKIEAALNE